MTARKKVLIIDYDRYSLESLKQIFEEKGYQVYTAKDGEEACVLFFSRKPDLVVLEPFLPRLHGFDFLGKASEKFSKPFPLIIVTGFYSEALCRRDYLNYFDNYAFFNKPFKKEDLLQAATQLLNTKNGNQEKVESRTESIPPSSSEALEKKEEDEFSGLPSSLEKVRTDLEDLIRVAKKKKAQKTGMEGLKGESEMSFKERDELDIMLKDYLQKLKSDDQDSQAILTDKDEADEEIENLLKGELSGLLSVNETSPESLEDEQKLREEEELDQHLASLVELQKQQEERSSPATKKREEKTSNESDREPHAEGQQILEREKEETKKMLSSSADKRQRGSSKSQMQDLSSIENKQKEKLEKQPEEQSGLESKPEEETLEKEIKIQDREENKDSLPGLSDKENKLKEKAQENLKKTVMSEKKTEKKRMEVRAEGKIIQESSEKEIDNEKNEINIFSGSVFNQIHHKKKFPAVFPVVLGVIGIGVVSSLIIIFLTGKSTSQKEASISRANISGQPSQLSQAKKEATPVGLEQEALSVAKEKSASSQAEREEEGGVNRAGPEEKGKTLEEVSDESSSTKQKTDAQQRMLEPLIIPIEASAISERNINKLPHNLELGKEEQRETSKEGIPSNEKKLTGEKQSNLSEGQLSQEKEQEQSASSSSELSPTLKTGDIAPLNQVDVPPQVIERVMPKYPPQALRFGVKGQVVVMVLISENGNVLETRLLRGIEKSFGLNEATLEAVMKWRFKPAEKDGIKVKVWKPIAIAFQGKDISQEEGLWN